MLPQVVHLAPGVHQFKFIVDSQWKHDPCLPIALDDQGNTNNVVEVKGMEPTPQQAVATSTQPATQHTSTANPQPERRSRDGSSNYSQIIPDFEDVSLYQTASAVPTLLRPVLPLFDMPRDYSPINVQLNHLYCGFADVVVIGTVSRYDDKFVTNVMYKPLGPTQVPSTTPPTNSPAKSSLPEPATQLSAVRISRAEIHQEGGQQYIVYVVEASLGAHGQAKLVNSSHRYRHFDMLDQMLRKEFGEDCIQALPPKKAFGNLQPEFVEERRKALEKYLQGCVFDKQIVTSTIFSKFLNTPQGVDGGWGGKHAETNSTMASAGVMSF